MARQVLRFLSLIGLLFLLASWAQASCPAPRLSDPASVQPQGDTVMVVVHASSTFDSRYSSKRGVDEAIRFAREAHIPLIYLVDDSPGQFYFMDDCAPDYWVFSEGGEIRFKLAVPRHLYIVGGHLELCLSTALHDILYQWAQQPARDIEVTYLMDAIYSNGKLIDQGERFYPDYARFMGIVNYGRPGGEHWPKLNLLETMGVIIDQDRQLEYIRQILPRWENTFPDTYRVDVRLNDSVRKVLRPASGWNPPTLSFHFVDSAISLQKLALP